VHAGSCDVNAALAIQGTQVQTASTHIELPAALAVSPGIRLLPAADYSAARPPGPPAAPPYSERMS
jgi:hypothetical protein